jgi:uncharacterized membrane protein HdeD (DUF308 family)
MKPLHFMLLKKDWLLLQGFLSVLLGVLLWFYPDLFVKATVILIGVLLALYAIVAFVTVMKDKEMNGASQAIMISAAISFIVGIILLASPALFVNLLVIIILGIIVIGLGLLQATEINLLKHQRKSFSALHYVSPVIIIIFGLLVIIQPAQAKFIVKLCAIGICYSGVSGLLYTFCLRKAVRHDSQLSENKE